MATPEQLRKEKELLERHVAAQKASVFFNIQITNPATTRLRELEELAQRDPCAVRGHRPAHRVDGGIVCYDCGARYA